jgi:uncharacterized protein (UPF0332 family)
VKYLEKTRLTQAQEALDEAHSLLDCGMDTRFVLTNLYYAFYYPIISLMNEGQGPNTMQSITIGLFDRQFISTGIFKQEYSDAVHRVFTIKPKCSVEKTQVSEDEVHKLLTLARNFIADVEAYCI